MSINAENIITGLYVFYGIGAVIVVGALLLIKYGRTEKEPKSKRTTTS